MVNNTVQRRAHEPSAMQSQLQGTGDGEYWYLKNGASQQRVWFCPLRVLKEVSTRRPTAPVSSSPCLESLLCLFVIFHLLRSLKRLFFVAVVPLPLGVMDELS